MTDYFDITWDDEQSKRWPDRVIIRRELAAANTSVPAPRLRAGTLRRLAALLAARGTNDSRTVD